RSLSLSVESREVTRLFREAMRVSGPFGMPVPEYLPLPRLHLPLIEPDLQISRIRLTDKNSCSRPRPAVLLRTELNQTQRVFQDLVGKTAIGFGPHFVLVTQPPTQPTTHVLLHHFVDPDHGPQTEVVGPTIQLLVECPDFLHGIPLARSPIRYFANLTAQLPDLFQRGSWSQIGPARPNRIVTSKRVPQKRKRTSRQATPPRLLLVHRQFQLGHHAPHRRHGLIGSAARADHEVVRIVDDMSLQPLLVAQLLPAQDEPAHIQVRQQRRGHSTLRRAPAFVLVACRSLRPPLLVRLLDRRFQPHLDQMQHVPITDPPSYRLHEVGVRYAVEIPAQVRIDYVCIARLQQFLDLMHSVQSTLAGAVGMLFRR